MTDLARQIADVASRELTLRSDPDKAGPMAAYMKTDMPFYGVQKAGRVEVMRALADRFAIEDAADYRAAVEALWKRPHREEKYIAIAVARRWRAHIGLAQLDLYLAMVREGAWWDLVDEIATNLIGAVWKSERVAVSPMADAWIDDDDMWIRRVALIGQNRHRGETDETRLFRYCRERAGETEFFIRKAIGWALREYSKTAPDRVAEFLTDNRAILSGLSYREGGKRLKNKLG